MAEASEPQAPMSDTVRGVAFLCAGLFVFSFQDIIIKLLSTSFPVHQIVFVRGLVAAPLIFLYVHYDSGFQALSTKRPVLHAVRALTMFGSYMSFYLALAAVPLTTAVALFFTAPLMITALSIPMLGEQVGWRRWLGVIVGFAGVLVILRPGVSDIEPAAFLAIVSAATYALAQLIGRRLGTTESASVMSFYMAIMFIYLGGILGLGLGSGEFSDGSNPALDFLFRGWAVPTWLEFAMIFTIGIISAMGFVLLTQAYRVGEANKVAPFEYTVMIWAMILSFVFFGSVPDLFTVLGAGLIAASGIYILHRERKNEQSQFQGDGPYKSRYADE